MFETVRARPADAILAGDVPLTLPLLARSYLLSPVSDTAFADALWPLLTSGPWSRSFAVAPGETARAVEHALREVMMATPTLRPATMDMRHLDPERRAYRHLSALWELWCALGDLLPPDLAILRGVLEARTEDILDPLHVIHDPQDMDLTPIERAVVTELIARHGLPADITERRAALIATRETCRGVAGTALRHLQAVMLSSQAGRVAQDDSIQVFGLRDAEAEAHVAASLAQRLLTGEADLSPSDIGLLLPSGPTYVPFVREAFARAGLPLSGLPAGQDMRDLAGECLLHLLTCLRPSAPVMARASLLRLALMPWSAEDGRKLSQAAMDGQRQLSSIATLNRRGRALLELLEKRPTRAHALAELLEGLPRLLSSEPALADDVATVAQRSGDLVAVLRAAAPNAEIGWDDLISHVHVGAAKPETDGPALLGAITMGTDGVPLARPVRHLMVLGCAEGTFPVAPGISPMFLDSEIELIRSQCSLRLPSRAAILSRRLAIFRRQLMTASHSLTILVPYRDAAGASLAPSASLCLLARCLKDCEEPERLILDLSGDAGDETLPRAPETKSLPLPPVAVPAVLDLGGNLLALRQDDEGHMRSQSPSRLDKLLVSPLAWLLNELGIAARVWEPEGLDVLTIGSLFHRMAEDLFPAGNTLPEEAEIETRLPDLLAAAVRELAPFLSAAPWMVERRRLVTEFTAALIAWRRMLATLGAEILGNELPLGGQVLGIPCRGFADSVLRLPDGGLVIVDHKTSSSGARRQRMEKGWDVQVEIYRALAQQSAGNPELETKGLAGNAPISVAYHTTRDRTLLLHGPAPARTAPGVEMVDADIGSEALARLGTELRALAGGRLNLPEWTLLDVMAKGGVRPYALDDSPLVSAFVRGGDTEDGDDA
ncbi:PD-(D/E)XK nuclease family protein [Xanthobacter sediminis]|uniref:PD-(D/E)XK nuclease family protein n=1 Tax=Xanthobacter sediminis TaxID=3119926 RepID=UPI00372C76E9